MVAEPENEMQCEKWGGGTSKSFRLSERITSEDFSELDGELEICGLCTEDKISLPADDQEEVDVSEP